MASIGDLYFTFRGDGARLTADAKKEGAKAGDAAGKGYAAKFKAAMSGGGLGKGLLQGLGIGAALGGVTALTSATAALTDEIFNSIDAASDQREAMSLGAQVFEDNSAAVEKWADGAAEAFGQSKTEAINFAAGFGNAFKNVGFTIDETTDKSKELTHLAADLGSAFNKSSEEAANALRSGLLGESEPLRAFGVFLDEAKVKAKAVDMGIADLGDTLTDNQKVTARYALIMEQTADSQGMFGRDTESFADAQKTLGATLENVRAEIGEELLPVMVEMAQFANDEIVPAIRDIVAALKEADDAFVVFGEIVGAVTSMGQSGATAYTRHLERELEAQVDAQHEAAEGIERALAGTRDDLDETGSAFGDTGHDAKAMAVDVAKASRDAADRVKAMRDSIIDSARDIVDRAYQVLSDKAELAAVNQEKADLRKIQSTRRWTAAEKAEYGKLTQRQEELVISLAENGAQGIQEVTDAVVDIKDELAHGNYLEKRAARGTIKMLEDLEAQLRQTGKVASSYHDVISGYTGGKQTKHKALATGGPVVPGSTYLVGERGPELFSPQEYGNIISAEKTADLVSPSPAAVDVAGPTINLEQHINGLPMQARTPVEVGYETRRAIRIGMPQRPPRRRGWQR